MKVLTKLLVVALAFAAVTDAADTLRRACDDGSSPVPDVTTPAPTTSEPAPTTPAPTTGKPDQTTPAPTTGKPDQTTPAPTTPAPTTGEPDQTTPAPTTPAPTTGEPDQTTPAPTTPAPTTPAPTTPAPTTPAPTTPAPGKFDKNQGYLVEGVDCAGYLRLPAPGRPLSSTDCVLDYTVQFTKDSTLTAGCVVCEPKWGAFVYDRTKPLEEQDVPLCGGKPLCTRLGGYGDLTEADLMCVLTKNGAAPVEDLPPTGCGLNDN